ncbi:MAG TPA: enoyl-CoA hydratase/isomerase family protein [Usitatibacter sp.]|nr:enoyl-CoA hydratase/isomerase family protein [Usitatibacter sp.]
MEERLTAAGGELAAVIRAGVATVTLNRPSALNALSLGMIEGLSVWLEAWRDDARVCVIVLRGAGEKAFCAGGDIRALHDGIKAGSPLPQRFFIAEYALDYAVHTYPKTIVAHMDGIVMGGGMGIGQGAALRIVGDRTRMAMPETAIGLFPDVGGSYFLSRLPVALGRYLALVGPTLRAVDAIYCGLADLDVSPVPVARGEIETLRAAIDEHFAHDRVDAIIASLQAEKHEAHAEWARKTLEALAKRSPTMLQVTLEQLRRGATLDLADCFRMELNLVHGCFDQGDFVEGIRALIVEKDNRPRWNPPALAEVDPASVARFFEPRWTPARHPLASLQQPARTP